MILIRNPVRCVVKMTTKTCFYFVMDAMSDTTPTALVWNQSLWATGSANRVLRRGLSRASVQQVLPHDRTTQQNSGLGVNDAVCGSATKLLRPTGLECGNQFGTDSTSTSTSRSTKASLPRKCDGHNGMMLLTAETFASGKGDSKLLSDKVVQTDFATPLQLCWIFMQCVSGLSLQRLNLRKRSERGTLSKRPKIFKHNQVPVKENGNPPQLHRQTWCYQPNQSDG